MAELSEDVSYWIRAGGNFYSGIVRMLPAGTSAEDDRRRVEAYAKQQEEVHAARKKAKALFLSCLTEEQRKQLDKDGEFKVTGSGGKNRYVISTGSTVENVYLTKWGKPVIMYCAAPRYTTISWDVWLAQKLILESDERAFLKVAVPNPS